MNIELCPYLMVHNVCLLVWQCIVLCWSLRGATETSRQTGKAKVRDHRNFVHRIHHYNLVHELYVSNSAQSSYIMHTHNTSHALIQVDFSESYTCAAQDEIQSAYWKQHQGSLFTAAIWHSG